jgi:peptidyl-prolyl cis-trans isomerase SurA
VAFTNFFATAYLSAALVSGSALDPNVRLIEETIAKVNNEIITRTEMEKQRAEIESELRLKRGLSGDELKQETSNHLAHALKDRIDHMLLVQKARDLNMKVDAEVTRWFAQLQVESKISDPDQFRAWIREQSGGVSYEDIRQSRTDLLLTQKVIGQEVSSKLNIAQSEIQKHYNDHKPDFVRQETVFLREILVAPTDASPRAWAVIDKQATDIVARARNHEKFSQLARDYSGAETAQDDGELGSFKRGELKRELEDQVFAHNKGYVTDPIQTERGYLILKVEERYTAGQAPLEDVRNEIMEKLYTARLEPALRTYLTKLREDAFLEIKPGYVDAGAAPNKDTSWKDPAMLKPETTTKEEVDARRHKRKLLGIL